MRKRKRREIDWLALEDGIRAILRRYLAHRDRARAEQALREIDALLGDHTGRGYLFPEEFVSPIEHG